MPIPSGATYLAKRSQLVADLADQVQDHACQGDGPPVWAAPGSHPSTALIGEIAVWRAANGINPQDPRPTGGSPTRNAPGPVETTPRPAYRPCHRSARQTRGPTSDRQHTPHLDAARPQPAPAPKTGTTSKRASRAQADSTPQSSDRGARNSTQWQDRQQTADLVLPDQARVAPRSGLVSSLRYGPRPSTFLCI